MASHCLTSCQHYVESAELKNIILTASTTDNLSEKVNQLIKDDKNKS
jgi:hypothetical protein